ncbi:MAG: cysteinyl-tRNA synthetase [Phycisphaerales bacterium]|jgi:cysteinyl-tRNA synthetase
MPLKLYNTATKKIEPVTPADPANVTFYTCGPTVYDDAHIGNFRSFLAADLLRRFIESPLCELVDINNPDGPPHKGPRNVRHVMNITDVGHMTDDAAADGGGEDKMATAAVRLEAAKKAGTVHADANVDPNDPVAISRFYAERFMDDAKRLGLKVAIEAGASDKARKDLMPFASEHIDGMKRVIEDLLERDLAYTGGEPGRRAIYFDVQKFAAYGTLSGNTLDKLHTGAGGRVDEGNQSEKRDSADFLLWKEDATHLMKWPAPSHAACEGWGEGYPGWHIECTAMSLANLANSLDAAKARHSTIDLHSGGEDNIFPHHECENAQSCAFTGAEQFARHWFHPRFLMVSGKKMSKSAGTFYTPRQLFEQGIEPAAVRLELIKSHYRNNADFSMQGLKDSQRRIERWRLISKDILCRSLRTTDASRLQRDSRPPNVPAEILSLASESLSDDLNISRLLAVVERAMSELTMYTLLDPTPEDEKQMEKEWGSLVEATKLPSEPLQIEDTRKLLESANEADHSVAALHLIDNILGVIFQPPIEKQTFSIGVFLPGATPSPEIEELLLKRAEAKKAKDFATADTIRDQLAAMKLAIKDVAGGRVEVGPA